MRPPAPGSRWPWWLLATAALTPRALGALLRPAWHDEYFTAWVASQPWSEMLGLLRMDSGPPLLYAAVKLIASPGIDPIAVARWLAVLAGTAAVIMAALAARRAAGPAAGWWCGALLATHPLAVAWSCEGRAYAFLLLAATATWLCLERLADGRGRGIGLGVVIALACWTHAFGLVLAGAALVASWTLLEKQRRNALIAIAAGLASHLAWLPVALSQPPEATAWMIRGWHSLPRIEQLLAPVRMLPPLAPFGHHLDLPSPPALVQFAAAVLLIALIASRRPLPRPVILAAVPAIGLTILATLGLPASYPTRGEALALAGFLGLAATAATGGRWRTWAALALVAGGCALTTASLLTWREAPLPIEARLANEVRRALPDGGTVVMSGYWRLGIWYRLGSPHQKFTLTSFPASIGTHPGWFDSDSDRPGRGEIETLTQHLRSLPETTLVIVTPGLPGAANLEEMVNTLRGQPLIRTPAFVLSSIAPRSSQR